LSFLTTSSDMMIILQLNHASDHSSAKYLDNFYEVISTCTCTIHSDYI